MRRLGAPKRLAYGSSPVEGMDLYPTKQANAPIHVFLHGGAWRAQVAAYYGFPAEMFVNAGAHYISVDFTNVVETKGDLDADGRAMPQGCGLDLPRTRRALVAMPSRIYLSGHSSGGHLGGVVMVTDWQKDFGLPKDTIKGAVLVSGMYDLKPVRLSSRSSYVTVTDDVEHALSAAAPSATSSMRRSWSVMAPGRRRNSSGRAGTSSTPWKAGKPAQLMRCDGYNHFEVIESIRQSVWIAGSRRFAADETAPRLIAVALLPRSLRLFI